MITNCVWCGVMWCAGAIVRFRFLYFAEYILPGDVFLFREGRAKGDNS
jgi:GTPase